MADLEEACPNGFYVEAFVKADAVATGEGVKGTSHSIPVLGFYGNWTDLSMFDVGSYAEYAYGMENRLPHLGNTKTNTLTVRYAGSSDTYYYGGNPFARDDEYLEERNALNNENGDALYKWVFSAVRNAARRPPDHRGHPGCLRPHRNGSGRGEWRVLSYEQR